MRCFCFFGRHFKFIHIGHDDFPMHDVPFPVYPGLHVQLKDPSVLLQKVLASHMNAGCTLIKQEGVGIFRFSGSAIFQVGFSFLCTEQLRFFGFVVHCGFRFFHFLASFFFVFLAKIKQVRFLCESLWSQMLGFFMFLFYSKRL